jgi:hypothetical protein
MAKGRKTGGRQKGTPNKNNQARMLALKELKASGKDPVTFFADLLRNEGAPLDIRFQAAKELAPYVHAKLASIEARMGGQTHEDRLVEAQRLLEEAETNSESN